MNCRFTRAGRGAAQLALLACLSFAVLGCEGSSENADAGASTDTTANNNDSAGATTNAPSDNGDAATASEPQTEAGKLRARLRELVDAAMQKQKPDLSNDERQQLVSAEFDKHLAIVKQHMPWSKLLDESERQSGGITAEKKQQLEAKVKDKTPKQVLQLVENTAMSMDRDVPAFGAVIIERAKTAEPTSEDALLLYEVLMAEVLQQLK